MSTVVLTVNKETLQKMKQHYQDALNPPFPNGAHFRARTPNAAITGYNSGKVVFQGKYCEKEANLWQEAGVKSESRAQPKTTRPTIPSGILTGTHIGSDETGTGDYFGPITVCAVYVEENQIELFRELGVQDSKNLTDDRIMAITEDLLHTNLPYSLLTLPNDVYNKRQAQGWTQGKMKAVLHHYAHKNVLEKLNNKPYKGIIVDQFVQESTYRKHIQTEGEDLLPKTYFLTKAESHSIAVAAASLIARTRFVREMDRLSDELGINLVKGASKKVDITIGKVIRKFGKEKLYDVGKVHFANTEKARQYI